MKKKYLEPTIDIIELDKKDFIVMSTEDDEVDVDFGDLIN